MPLKSLYQKRYRLENYCHLSIMVFSVVFLFYPFQIKESEIRQQKSTLSTSLKTTTFRDSLCISLGSYGPLLMDCIVDYLQFGENSKIFVLTRVFPIVSLILTTFLMLYYVCDDGNSSLYYSLFNAELITLLGLSYCFLRETSSSIWTNRRICFCFGSFCCFINMRVYEGHSIYIGNILVIIAFTSFISYFSVYFLRSSLCVLSYE